MGQEPIAQKLAWIFGCLHDDFFHSCVDPEIGTPLGIILNLGALDFPFVVNAMRS